MPDFSFENQHTGLICGIDEVGRGPLAGPVVAACVVIPTEKRELDFIQQINDSKKLSDSKKEYLYNCITKHCLYAVHEISPQEIDQINILQASLKAMKESYNALSTKFEITHALIDGNKAPEMPCPTTTVVKGDSKSKTIAAASIIAKVHRDRIMKELSKEYPQYGWDKNAAYPTKQHREAILQYGITPHHRRSFRPVANMVSNIQG